MPARRSTFQSFELLLKQLKINLWTKSKSSRSRRKRPNSRRRPRPSRASAVSLSPSPPTDRRRCVASRTVSVAPSACPASRPYLSVPFDCIAHVFRPPFHPRQPRNCVYLCSALLLAFPRRAAAVPAAAARACRVLAGRRAVLVYVYRCVLCSCACVVYLCRYVLGRSCVARKRVRGVLECSSRVRSFVFAQIAVRSRWLEGFPRCCRCAVRRRRRRRRRRCCLRATWASSQLRSVQTMLCVAQQCCCSPQRCRVLVLPCGVSYVACGCARDGRASGVPVLWRAARVDATDFYG